MYNKIKVTLVLVLAVVLIASCAPSINITIEPLTVNGADENLNIKATASTSGIGSLTITGFSFVVSNGGETLYSLCNKDVDSWENVPVPIVSGVSRTVDIPTDRTIQDIIDEMEELDTYEDLEGEKYDIKLTVSLSNGKDSISESYIQFN